MCLFFGWCYFRFFDSVTNRDSPLPPTVQQAPVGNNDKASHLNVDISELIREAYEVLQDVSVTVLVSDVYDMDDLTNCVF